MMEVDELNKNRKQKTGGHKYTNEFLEYNLEHGRSHFC